VRAGGINANYFKGTIYGKPSRGTNIDLKEQLWKTIATDTEKRHNILEKGRFLLADCCKIGVNELRLNETSRIKRKHETNLESVATETNPLRRFHRQPFPADG
jgi:hypothetical protein